MLIEFRVSNYRSIGEEQILSLVPAPKQREHPENIIHHEKHEALNAVAIYGANSSGKSNLLLSMSLLDKLIHLSARSSSTSQLPYDPFLLRDGWDQRPTKFEITFLVESNRYRYGIEFTKIGILKEWLFRKSQGREVPLFMREGDQIDPSSGFKGNSKIINSAIEATRPNALFLSTCDILNVDEAKIIFNWFRHFNMIDGLNTERGEIETVNLWDEPKYRKQIEEYLERLNLGFVGLDISVKDFEASELPDILNENARNILVKKLAGAKGFSVTAKHRSYSKDGSIKKELTSWKFEDRESAGTKKAFHLSGPILWALINGGVLIIDELEAKIHPILTLATIDLFLNRETNPKNAQLIFATHDTNLLTYSNLRRDQIYFSEKNKWESTEIYSLSDFVYLSGGKSEKYIKDKPDADKEKRYFEGRYGAVPVFGETKKFGLIKYGKKK